MAVGRTLVNTRGQMRWRRDEPAKHVLNQVIPAWAQNIKPERQGPSAKHRDLLGSTEGEGPVPKAPIGERRQR